MSITHQLPYEWQVGLRYTRAGKRSGRNSFISFISMASVAGIALGVAALIVVLSVMNGFEKEVTARMLSVLAHVEIFDARGEMPGWRETAQQALRHPEVRASAPFVDTQAMLISDGVMKPVVVRGVIPAQESTVSEVATHMREGRFDTLQPGSYNIVIGRALAAALVVGVGVLVAMNIHVIVPFIEEMFKVKFLSQEIYLISEIPSQLRWDDVGWIGAVAVLLAFLATLYPSWSASRVKPAEALRYE